MNAYEICQEIERRMAAMGVVTTAHYDAGTELIAEAIRQAVLAEREACAKLAEELFPPFDDPEWFAIRLGAAQEVADEIRARGDV